MDLNCSLEKSMDGFEVFFWRKAWIDLTCFFFVEKSMDGFEFFEKSMDGFDLFFREKHGWI